MITFGSLFSGIGGMDLGLERAGMKCKWQVEINKYCLNVLSQHWPDVPKHKDIKKCGVSNLETVDLICGGFPCQDISTAGKGIGIHGSRSGLWKEMFRIIRELRPRYVIVENVPALLGRGIDVVLGDLASCGYDAEWKVLHATWFGIPQKRPRLFIVTYPTSICEQKIFYKDPIYVEGNTKGVDAKSRKPTDIDDKDNREGSLPLLGDSIWTTIPYGERSGNDDGIPNRMDRLKALGNACVPQVVEWIGRRIMETIEND